MQHIFSDSSEVERLAKQKFGLPPFLMMEHAASALRDFILRLTNERSLVSPRVLILCGKGNNGGDGLALARLLLQKVGVCVCCPELPVAEEARVQYEMAKRLGVKFCSQDEFLKAAENPAAIIVDCLYGTGFHGELSPQVCALLDGLNAAPGIRIACDVPSGLRFKADFTVTMGCQKLALYSDRAKSVCGTIVCAELGVPRDAFESVVKTNLFLLEKADMRLPFRREKSVHKGSFGHTCVFAGEKSGAGILAATAALHFGSGLVSLVQTEKSDIGQFRISPELMLSDAVPAKASCVVLGPGLGNQPEAVRDFVRWFASAEKPACVLDADLFHYREMCAVLGELNGVAGARIILTPHPKELAQFEGIAIEDAVENRLEIGKRITEEFVSVTVIMKGANTYVASGGKTFICADGNPSLAKAGSGDVLAGMAGALLAQGYCAQDAAITAAEAHALLSGRKQFADSFALSPEVLIRELGEWGQE